MPYIPQKDRQILFPTIENLKNKICSLCQSRSDIWDYSRYAALKVIKDCTARAAQQYMKKDGYRYWSIVAMIGVTMNIAQELHDRVVSKFMGRQRGFNYRSLRLGDNPENAKELDELLFELSNKISFLAAPKEINPDGYDYDMAFAGLLNYSFTELVPAVFQGVLDKAVIGMKVDLQDAREIISFWLSINDELYATVARSYEDEQIKKSGDVEIYKKLLEPYAHLISEEK